MCFSHRQPPLLLNSTPRPNTWHIVDFRLRPKPPFTGVSGRPGPEITKKISRKGSLVGLQKVQKIPEKSKNTQKRSKNRYFGTFSGIFWDFSADPPKQMDEEGLGRKLLLTPSDDPRRAPENQTAGTVGISQHANPASTFELSQCRHCKQGLPGPRRGFRVASGSLSPKTAASICTL